MKYFFLMRASRLCRPIVRSGFTLIEVVLAMGVATFAILAIVSLLPAGIQSSKDSLEESQAINVLGQIIADRQSTPFYMSSVLYSLPALTNTMSNPTSGFLGVKDNYRPSTSLSQARYRVDYTLIPPNAGMLSPYQGYFRVSWPAGTPVSGGHDDVETFVAFPQP